ncbi:IDEAL domain-containing protein [Paenibacillus sp. NPDC058174]|uniref:IDEAL domain-containing protein n=1 Tax=Paenibacillus sp. NPDC058174 TaxID=3346366 RepID=UPI0036DDD929
MKYEVSDWVQGRTVNGEFILGFVEQIDALQGIVKVNVVKSDNEGSIGKPTVVREKWLKKLPEQIEQDEASVRNLIDLALSTWDEAWFMELTEQLNRIETEASQRKGNDAADESRLSAFI